jgi:hypothetical protein
MCSGPVGNGQSYWGLIQVKITGNGMTAAELDTFKANLTAFLNNATQTGLPNNATAGLANGTIKTNDTDGTSIELTNRRP